MSENEEIKKAADEDEDWAVLPFDEAEDETRWAKLELELDELAENVARHEAVHGEILMKQNLTEVKSEDENEETDEPF